MSVGEQLLGRVQTVRRRLLRWAAIEGACLGALLGLGGVEAVAAAGRVLESAGAAAWGRLPGLLGGLVIGTLAGACWGIWRRPVTVAGTARLMDQHAGAAAGEHGDRIRVALALAPLAESGPTSFARAAVTDGFQRAMALEPGAIAPARWPRGSLGLAAVLLLALPVHWWSRDGWERPTHPRQSATGESTAATGGEKLVVARREAQALADLARTLNDRELRVLADRLLQTLAGLSTRPLEGGGIDGLVDEVRVAAERARLAAVKGRAAAGGGPSDRGEHGQSATAAREEPRSEPVRRLGGINEQGASAGGPPAGAQADPEAEQARRLEQLRRGLDDQAEESIGQEPGRRGRPPLQDAAAARDRLARAEESLRRALGQAGGGAGPGAGRRGAERTGAPGASPPSGNLALSEFERRARGGSGAEGERTSGGGVADRERSGNQAGTGTAGGGPGADGVGGGAAPRQRETRRTPPAADGVEPGQSVEASLEEGPGPSRAESIALGAEGGFAGRSYDRTYRAYRAAVEQTLEGAAVPDGRQQLVRRYFDLIRPRGR